MLPLNDNVTVDSHVSENTKKSVIMYGGDCPATYTLELACDVNGCDKNETVF